MSLSILSRKNAPRTRSGRPINMLEDISAGKNSGAEAYCRRAGRVDALKVLCDIDVSHVGGVHTTHADEVLDVIAQAGYGYYVSRKFTEKLVMGREGQASKI